MKKFVNLMLVAGAAVALSACACVNSGEQHTHAAYQTAGQMPTYSKDCVPGEKHDSKGERVFRRSMSK